MQLFRIAQEKFANDLSGNGAKLFVGCWNSEGLPVVYAASYRSLALLETLAHTPAKILNSRSFILVTLDIPDNNFIKIEVNDLPADWDVPDIRPFTQKTGDQFLKSQKKLALSVPSVLMPEENNYIINPMHPDFRKVKIIDQRRILFDKRAVSNL